MANQWVLNSVFSVSSYILVLRSHILLLISPTRSSASRLSDHDFERHRGKLNRIFFRCENPSDAPLPLIGTGKNGPEEVEADFWKFLRKFKAFEKRKGTSSTVDKTKKSQCFDLLPQDPKDLLNRIPFQGNARSN